MKTINDLPQELYIENKKYELICDEYNSKNYKGWCSIKYVNDKLPPFILNERLKEYMYLVSMCPSKQEAIDDMFDRLNGANLNKIYE